MIPVVKHISQHCWVGTWQDTIIQLWGTQTEAPAVREVRAFAEQYFQRVPGPKVALVSIEADSEPPDARARSELKALGQLFESNLVALAYVYAGTGFRAAAIRSVMAAILFVNSLPMKLVVKTFARPADACEWLAERIPQSELYTAADRAMVVNDMLKRFRAREKPAPVVTV